MPTMVTVTVVASYPNSRWHLYVKVSESSCVDSHTKSLPGQPGNATSTTGHAHWKSWHSLEAKTLANKEKNHHHQKSPQTPQNYRWVNRKKSQIFSALFLSFEGKHSQTHPPHPFHTSRACPSLLRIRNEYERNCRDSRWNIIIIFVLNFIFILHSSSNFFWLFLYFYSAPTFKRILFNQ